MQYLAIDLGSSSARIMLADGNKNLALQDFHTVQVLIAMVIIVGILTNFLQALKRKFVRQLKNIKSAQSEFVHGVWIMASSGRMASLLICHIAIVTAVES